MLSYIIAMTPEDRDIFAGLSFYHQLHYRESDRADADHMFAWIHVGDHQALTVQQMVEMDMFSAKDFEAR